MKKLIKNIDIVTPEGELSGGCIGIDGKYIDYVGAEQPEGYEQIIDGRGGIAIPGFVNAHTHIPMTLFRGYAEDMPLHDWLFTRIFPAEDKLTGEMVRNASLLAAAEMLACGTTSFSEMYYFCDYIVEAVAETGIKSNISRSISAFDRTDPSQIIGFAESKELYEKYNNSADGRIKIDLSLHSEYTNNEEFCRLFADYARSVGATLHIHISETEKEHRECIEKYGVTPTAFFERCGCFDVPLLGAHCVWATPEDMKIFASHGASIVHNPSSNLKLGSGIAPVTDMLAAGINVCLGSDGCASNNNTDMFTEMHLAALLQKGRLCDPAAIPVSTALRLATVNGAKAQGRENTGVIEVGKRADIAVIDTSSPHMCPIYSREVAVVHSARASDVSLTMVDGEVLYRNGEYTTIDIEKVRHGVERLVSEKYR